MCQSRFNLCSGDQKVIFHSIMNYVTNMTTTFERLLFTPKLVTTNQSPNKIPIWGNQMNKGRILIWGFFKLPKHKKSSFTMNLATRIFCGSPKTTLYSNPRYILVARFIVKLFFFRLADRKSPQINILPLFIWLPQMGIDLGIDLW